MPAWWRAKAGWGWLGRAGSAGFASLRLPCDARAHGPSRNSLRSLRSLRSDNRDESVHEARCRARPRALRFSAPLMRAPASPSPPLRLTCRDAAVGAPAGWQEPAWRDGRAQAHQFAGRTAGGMLARCWSRGGRTREPVDRERGQAHAHPAMSAHASRRQAHPQQPGGPLIAQSSPRKASRMGGVSGTSPAAALPGRLRRASSR